MPCVVCSKHTRAWAFERVCRCLALLFVCLFCFSAECGVCCETFRNAVLVATITTADAATTAARAPMAGDLVACRWPPKSSPLTSLPQYSHSTWMHICMCVYIAYAYLPHHRPCRCIISVCGRVYHVFSVMVLPIVAKSHYFITVDVFRKGCVFLLLHGFFLIADILNK